MEAFRGITIDPPGAGDLDDAIWVTPTPDGWLAQVAFPHAGDALPPGSPEDKGARAAGATVYGPQHVTPMVSPLTVSRLSLTEDGNKSVFLVDIPVSREGSVGVPYVRRAVFTSAARLSYGMAREILGDASHPLHAMLAEASRMAQTLQSARAASGAIGLRALGTLHATDEDGRVVTVPAGAYASMRIVHEMMVLANAELAALCAGAGLPMLYRNHVVGASGDRGELLETLDAAVRNSTSMAPIAGRLDHLVGRARLGSEPEGHWALNLSSYAWFTSPIRRYADLANQRMLASLLDGTPAPYAKDELEALADHLNGVSDAARERTRSFLKGYSGARAETMIDAGRLGRAGANDFSAVVKAAVAQDAVPEAVLEEAGRRIERLTSKDLARLLFAGGAATDLVLGHLRSSPHVAVSIANYCVQDPQVPWLDLEWDERDASRPGQPMFAATARAVVEGKRVVSPEMRGPSKKAAAQAATVELLAIAAGRPADIQPLPPEPPPQPKPTPAVDASANARGQLQELCQKRGWPFPSFDVETSGPSHAPSFVAVATVTRDGVPTRRRSPEARTRKEAERLAAAALVAALLGTRA